MDRRHEEREYRDHERERRAGYREDNSRRHDTGYDRHGNTNSSLMGGARNPHGREEEGGYYDRLRDYDRSSTRYTEPGDHHRRNERPGRSEHRRDGFEHEQYGRERRQERGPSYDLSGYDPEDLRGSGRSSNRRSGLSPEGVGRDRARDRVGSDREEYREYGDLYHDRDYRGRSDSDDRGGRERYDRGRMDNREWRNERHQHPDRGRDRLDRAGDNPSYSLGWEADPDNYLNDRARGPHRNELRNRRAEEDEEHGRTDYDRYQGRGYGFSWRDGSNDATWRNFDRWGDEYSNNARSEGFGWNRGSTRDPHFWSSPDRER